MRDPDVSALLERHSRLLRRIVFAYCKHPSDREDVLQEIAIQLWRSRERYDPRFAETTWIYRIALNVAISYYRRERRHAHGDDSDAIATEPPVSRDVQLLRNSIDELGPLDKALVLMHLDGNDHHTIAAVVGVSVSNVGTKLMRIRQRLRVAMKGEPHG